MAPSSQSEEALDVDQVTLQEAPLPPPVHRVMDPGQLFEDSTCLSQHVSVTCVFMRIIVRRFHRL